MKINKLILQNIGPYVGSHILKFDNSKKDKNITLIGGKNGAGKTTIFSSIQLCLYGHKSFGYEAIGYNYYNEVYKLINTELKTRQDEIAKICVEIVVDDGKYNSTFYIQRSWEFKGKNIKENCLIKKNGAVIEGDELNNFVNYLDNLISAELFNFYFFDGEKIGEYFLSEGSDYNFKKAFLALCGLDSISIMVKNFERLYKLRHKNCESSKHYYKTKTEFNELKQRANDTILRIEELKKNESELRESLSCLDFQYAKAGGLGVEDWKLFNKVIIEEENKREQIYKQLKEIAQHNLPFVIMHKQLKKLSYQIEMEEEFNRAQILKASLYNDEVKSLINSSLLKNVNVDDFINSIYVLINKSNALDSFKEMIALSSGDSSKMQRLIDKKLEYNVKEITKLNKSRKKSLLITERTRAKLAQNNLDRMADFVEERESINFSLNDVIVKIAEIEHQSIGLDEEILIKNEKYDKALKAFELELRDNSISDMSSKLMLVYKDIEEKLILKYATMLQIKFVENFKSIINKDGFIDGIEVDMKLNVRPYKYIRLDKSEFISLLEKQGEEYFMKEVGVRNVLDIKKVIASKTKKVKLPIFIKSEFSRGEKQVYIMALYLSLLQVAKTDVPFIIDTPFARIDSEHRSKIIDFFFKKINSQLIILSTDEELVGNNKEQIDEKVSGEILLESLSHGKTKAMQNKYFEVKYGI